MHALFVGRFQPFHLGHLLAVNQILKQKDFLTIVIGSAEDNFTPDNPFTAGERYQMIHAALSAEKIAENRYTIIPVRNINNYALWIRHLETLLPPFETVYSGSPLIKRLFEREKKYHIRAIKKEFDICASQIRNAMLENKNWQKYLPAEVAKLIETFNGIERLKAIAKSIPS